MSGVARSTIAGMRTILAGLIAGGYNGGLSNSSEEYDGTSWSSGGDLNTARDELEMQAYKITL